MSFLVVSNYSARMSVLLDTIALRYFMAFGYCFYCCYVVIQRMEVSVLRWGYNRKRYAQAWT